MYLNVVLIVNPKAYFTRLTLTLDVFKQFIHTIMIVQMKDIDILKMEDSIQIELLM